MIAYVVPRRGKDIAGLVRYLFGPGRHNEHSDPHVIAAAGILDIPDGHRPGSWGEVTQLGRDLDDYRVALRADVSDGHVWHCAISLPASDRALSDSEWAQVARAAVDRLGFSGATGREPTRWTAVHHGPSARGSDHIHLVVNLVREDGTKAATGWDRAQMSKVCREFEQRFGLQVIHSRRGAGMPGLSRAEIERARREGLAEPERATVARRVRGCAAAASSEADFVQQLRAAGLAPRPWYAAGGREVTGYSVARRAADGQHPLRFGGGKLAPDLTLGRLREHWDASPAARGEALAEWAARSTATARRDGGYDGRTWQQAAAAAARAVSRLADIPADDTAAWAGAARETAGVLAAWSGTAERRSPGPLARAADVLAASAQTRRGEPRARRGETADLRGIAVVVLAGSPAGRGSAGAVLLLRQVSRLMEVIHDAHLARGEADRAAQLAAAASGELARLHRAPVPVPGPGAQQAGPHRSPAASRGGFDNGRG